jgi:peroxiredoxin
MKVSHALTAASATAIAVVAFGALTLGGGVSPVSATAAPAVIQATRVDNFRLPDQNYQSHELYRMRDAKAVVLITQMNGCPVSRNTASAIKALQAAYASKGVEFMMLNSSKIDTREAVLTEAKEYGYDMPVLMDQDQLVGEQLGVTRTAEVIILDPKTWKVIYRGPVDDKVTYERQKAAAEHTWAKDALDATLAGKTVAVASEPAVGCLIDFPSRTAARTAKISYVHDVAPIIEQKCVMCHQPGGIGPIALTKYEQVKAFSPMIREVIRTQRMPPWRADPDVGHFKDDKSLSMAQRETLVHWVEAGAPRGEGADPLAKVKLGVADWPLGKPDLILDIPAYTIPANGIVDYQRPFVKNPLNHPEWIKASTVKVNNRQGVHHILTGYMEDVPAAGQPAFEQNWGVSVGGYAVGSESQVNPISVGAYLPVGGAIGFQNHYTPYGKEVTENSQIGLYFYKPGEVPKMVMHNLAIANPTISIPAGEEAHPEHGYIVVPHDMVLYSAFPHAHYRGASANVILETPDGKKKELLALSRYDFNWQREYTFDKPVMVPAGSRITTYYTYDNSPRNPANPDPKRTVPWGDQSFDEMLYTALRYRWVDETSSHLMPQYDADLKANQLMGILDHKMDGKITKAEFRKDPMSQGLLAKFDTIDRNHDGVIDSNEMLVASNYMNQMRKQRHAAEAAKAATAKADDKGAQAAPAKGTK